MKTAMTISVAVMLSLGTALGAFAQEFTKGVAPASDKGRGKAHEPVPVLLANSGFRTSRVRARTWTSNAGTPQ